MQETKTRPERSPEGDETETKSIVYNYTRFRIEYMNRCYLNKTRIKLFLKCFNGLVMRKF